MSQQTPEASGEQNTLRTGKTGFERTYLLLEPFLPPFYRQIRSRIRSIVRDLERGEPVRILDVGGRKSHYTIGVNADLMISDLPRTSDVQRKLNLGVNNNVIRKVRTRRNNVSYFVYDDMTTSAFADSSLDCVVAIEVLEHVEQDGAFLEEVHRVLRPGGVFFMTTPNGDFVENTNPDHQRHYHRAQLRQLLEEQFGDVSVSYAVRSGTLHRWGLKSWSTRHPLVTLRCMAANVLAGWGSSPKRVSEMAEGTEHLVCFARKQDVASSRKPPERSGTATSASSKQGREPAVADEG